LSQNNWRGNQGVFGEKWKLILDSFNLRFIFNTYVLFYEPS
jgi:hypothetical protein